MDTEAKMIINEFMDLVCNAAPLAWCTGRYDSHAHEWEKRAVIQIRRATEYLKVAQQHTTAKVRRKAK
jgi:tellurite resistance protein